MTTAGVTKYVIPATTMNLKIGMNPMMEDVHIMTISIMVNVLERKNERNDLH